VTEKSKLLCAGCTDNFYNQQPQGCWNYDDAKVVTRYRIGWWVAPTEPGAFTKVDTLGCHHAPGKYAHRDKLPDFAKP
jgi:hypothetical protein